MTIPFRLASSILNVNPPGSADAGATVASTSSARVDSTCQPNEVVSGHSSDSDNAVATTRTPAELGWNRHDSTDPLAALTSSIEHASSTAILMSSMLSRSKSWRMATTDATARSTGSCAGSAPTLTSISSSTRADSSDVVTPCSLDGAYVCKNGAMTVRRQPPDWSTGPPTEAGGSSDDGTSRKPSKGDITAQAILDTAERLLEKRSLREIGIDELAAGAGVSRSTFYFHFESRDDVLYELSDRLIGEIYAEGLVWFRRSDEEPVAAIRRALTRMVELWRAHGPVLRASVRGRETDPRLAVLWSEIARRFMRSTAVQIESERNAGLAPPGPPTARGLARALVIMNESTCYQQTLVKKSAEWDAELVESLTAIWVRSIYGPNVAFTS